MNTARVDAVVDDYIEGGAEGAPIDKLMEKYARLSWTSTNIKRPW